MPVSNVMVSVYDPSDVHCAAMYIIRSTPFTRCSMGEATVFATTSELAPG